jgi:hypothetical protein
VSNRDRDFRPTRRRDFADDDYEPPSRNFGYAPPRGPQFDSPSGPPIRATVIMGLAEGQRVAVAVADGQKGPEAASLRLI